MKTLRLLVLSLAGASFVSAQDIVVDAPPFPTNGESTPPPAEPVDPGPPAGEEPPATPPPAPAIDPGMPEDGWQITNASLNDIFQFLARSAGRQYFHNARIAGPEYLVTGHLNDGNPLQQMEELAFMYGLSLHVKGNTIYALTQAQLAQLPSSEFHYQLRYLRPSDIDQIKQLIQPILSPGTGIVNFEPKTNTIIIIDTATRIDAARNLLHNIDKAKGQIIVETRILRVNTTAAERVGLDWSQSLGAQGVPMGVARDLGSIFGLDSPGNAFVGGINPNLVLTPFVASGVLRALADGGIAKQISNPTLITEDNEQASISIIDRIPIVTSTITNSGGAGVEPTITEEVRYKVDQEDKSIAEDPEAHREIGISLVVTPTLLPDGTIRMRMRPRSAQVTENVETLTGNVYPRVTESMLEALARVPDGHSLVVGGFYGETTTEDKNKVPLLGDIPGLNFFFKSRESIKEKSSLVFIVTPKSYDPTQRQSNAQASSFVRGGTDLPCDSTWVDPQNPGPAHEPNIRRTVRGLQPHEAPYYPRAEELAPADETPRSRPRFARGSRR